VESQIVFRCITRSNCDNDDICADAIVMRFAHTQLDAARETALYEFDTLITDPIRGLCGSVRLAADDLKRVTNAVVIAAAQATLISGFEVNARESSPQLCESFPVVKFIC
jgi:hypothetical protein